MALQSGGQQVLVLVPWLGFSVQAGQTQHGQPLWVGGHFAGSVEDNEEEQQQEAHERVAGYGHLGGHGESRRRGVG